MRYRLHTFILLLFPVIKGCNDPKRIDFRNADLPIEKRVDALLAQMTVEEKLAQLKALHGNRAISKNEGITGEEGSLQNKMQHGIGAIENIGDKNTPGKSAERTNELQKFLVEQTRLGIPALVNSECLHGHHAFNATSFPVPLAMACSWNTDLVNKAFDVAGREARLRGSHEAHTPVLDLGRDPRWGRIEETFGEDVYLTSQMALASVSGLQGGTEGEPGTTHIVSSAKHFAGYGQVDGGRNFAPTNITKRVLLDEILKPFEYAITKSHGLGIMASHCEIDGIPAHASTFLLEDILRQKWGFTGIVVSDYNDITRLEEFHHVVETPKEAAELALAAGVDLDIPVAKAYRHLDELVKEKPGLMKRVDQSVARILTLKFKLGLFENPYADPKKADEIVNCAQHRAIAKSLADESVVLLKNPNGMLPLSLKKPQKIAVIGPKATSKAHGVYASANDSTVTILEGISRLAGNDAEVNYEQGCIVGTSARIDGVKTLVERSLKEELPGINKAVALAKTSDVAIVCLGSEVQFSQEAYYAKGHTADRSTLNLIGNQMELLRSVVETGTPTIVVLMHGRPLVLTEMDQLPVAILDIFYPGQSIGTTTADVLFGKVNPSGRLSISYPRSVGQLPVYYSQKPSGFFKHYIDGLNAPLYPFGYGLSYSEFEYTSLTLNTKTMRIDEPLHFSVAIRNTSGVPGKEVIQVYARDLVASVTRPIKQLVGFQKISLEPGEEKQVSFTLHADQLAFTGLDMKPVAEPGEFRLMIGKSSRDIVLEETFTLK